MSLLQLASYHARLSAEEARLAELKDPVDDEEAMVSRLNSGLSVLQQVGYLGSFAQLGIIFWLVFE